MTRPVLAAGVTACLCVVGLTACQRAATDTASTPSQAPAGAVTVAPGDATTAGIETTTVRAVERTGRLEVAGVVGFDERRTARLGSLVEGVVHRLRLQPGDAVARGAVVALLHSHVVHDAWADYFKALAAVRRADADLAYARTAEQRAATLVADKALSAQELDRARADSEVARQGAVHARAEQTRAEQDLHHYGVTARPDADPAQQEDVPVVAPFTGTVIERLVTESSAVTPGTPLLVVADLSQVWVTAEIDEALVGRVAPGQTVAITAAAYPGERFTGTLAAIGDVVSANTRRVTLRLEVPNRDRRLKPQMFVTATIGDRAPRTVLTVPSRAIQTMDGESVVFVRADGDRFTRRAVVTGGDDDGQVEIVRGLGAGEIVATAGAFLLKSSLAAPAEPD